MTLPEAFLADVLANPDDDTPRLVYADWLEDHGQPERAEFIRLQCQLAKFDEEVRPAGLVGREQALLAAHGAAWTASEAPPFPAALRDRLLWLGRCLPALGFRRGFLEATLEAGARDFRDHGEALCRGVVLRRLRLLALRYAPSLAGGPARSPLLARAVELDLSGSMAPDEDLAELAASAHVGRLRALELRGGQAGPDRNLTEAGVRALARSPNLTHLRSLDLSHQRLGRGALAALLAPGGLPRLEELGWADNRCGDWGFADLAASPLLRRLTTLRLGRNGLTADAARALAAAGKSSLRVLDLGNPPDQPRRNAVGDAGLAALLAGRALANVRTLRLEGNDLGTGAAWALAAARHLPQFEVLGLSGNRLGPRAAEALLVLPFPHLRQLVLTGNPLDGPSCRALRRHYGSRVKVSGP